MVRYCFAVLLVCMFGLGTAYAGNRAINHEQHEKEMKALKSLERETKSKVRKAKDLSEKAYHQQLLAFVRHFTKMTQRVNLTDPRPTDLAFIETVGDRVISELRDAKETNQSEETIAQMETIKDRVEAARAR